MATNAAAGAPARNGVSPGQVGVLAQVIFAAALAAVALAAGEPSPEPVPRGIALGLLYAAPAAVAFLGMRGGRKSLLVGAAIADVGGAPLSWSGFTLLFLVPAILFVGETGRIPAGTRASIGLRLSGLLLAIAVAGLLVGAGLALLALTEPLCWIATHGATDTAYTIVPTAENVPIGSGQSGGCTSAAITLGGAGTAAVLAIGAIALAALGASVGRVAPGARAGSEVERPS
ncbi:MAG TPA: hypothetical protein VK831_07560 [Candidatus Deferrimicrobiaceae bacterium]|nr:hypothetical protein [Candidatus Deferrimicrobiaceae bacterium]